MGGSAVATQHRGYITLFVLYVLANVALEHRSDGCWKRASVCRYYINNPFAAKIVVYHINNV